MELKLSLLLEQSEPESMGIDSFKGKIKEFKLYLMAQRIFLEAGYIAP